MSVRGALLLPCVLWCVGCGQTDGDDGGHPDSWIVHVELVGPVPEDLPVVLVHRDDGSLRLVTKVDSNGRADVEVPHRGQVSVFTERPAVPQVDTEAHYVDTYTEVDHEVTFRVPITRTVPPAVIGPISFVATGPLPPKTQRVEVSLPCTTMSWSNVPWNQEGDPTVPVVIPSIPRCSDAKESVALVSARGEKSKVLGVKLVEHVALAPGAKTYEVSFAAPEPVETYAVHFAGESGQLAVANRAPSDPYGTAADIEYRVGGYDPSGTVSVTLPVVSEFFEQRVLSARAGSLVRTQPAAQFEQEFSLDPSALARTDRLGKIDDPVKIYPIEWSYPEGGRFGTCHSLGVRWHLGGAYEWRIHRRFLRQGEFTTPELPEELASYAMPNALDSVQSSNIDTELDCGNVADIPWNSTIAGD